MGSYPKCTANFCTLSPVAPEIGAFEALVIAFRLTDVKLKPT